MFEWLFKYSYAEYARGEWLFASDWPTWLLLAAFAVGAALLIALALRRGRALGAARLSIVAVLQLAMLALLLLVLWEPSLLLRTLRPGENAVAILLDGSASMALVDPQQARLAEAKAALESAPLQSVMHDYQPRRYQFGGDATPIQSFERVTATANATAVADSVLQVLRASQSAPLGAVIVLSDGADSAGFIDAEKLAAISAFGVPVHAIGIGREAMPEDLELQDVLLPEKALPGSTLSARISVRHDGGGTARIKAYDGQQFLASVDVPLPATATLTSAYLGFALPDAGYRNLRFTIDPQPGERQLANNTRTRTVQVAPQRASILYVEGEPRWELKFMRRALDHDPGVRLVSLLRTSANGYYRQGVDEPDELQSGFPTDRAGLFRYQAVIIGSVPAAWFKPAQLQLLREFVSDRGGSLLMLAGPNGLGDGGWGNSSLSGLLPAQLPDRHDGFVRQQAQAVLTPRGRRNAMLKFSEDPAANDRQWAELPRIADYQALGALRPAAVSLLNLRVGAREQPLLVTQPYGRGHALILATGGTWRWQMLLPLADQRHEQFWRQLARGLVSDVPEPFTLEARSQGNKARIRAELHDASFLPLRDAAVSATASSGSDAVTVPLAPVAGQPGIYQGEAPLTRSGSYFVDATARRGAQALATARTLLQHDQGGAEQYSLRRNTALLTQLARATGGRFWRSDELDGLPEAIRAAPSGVMRQELRPVWDAPIIFVLLLALKAVEWLLRRRWSVV